MLYIILLLSNYYQMKSFNSILQLLARKEDAAFHRSERKAEAFGNLAVLETGHMHGERDFIVAWKGIDDAMHFFQVVGTSVLAKPESWGMLR